MFKDLIDDFDDPSIQPETFLDVPFVPTDDRVIEVMLDLAKVNAKDVLYDLGSGDGRIVVAAAKKYGARGIGLELDPLRVADAMEFAGYAKVEFLVDFLEEDLFEADISEATVVTLYLLEAINLQLRPRLLTELQPGTRIVSHAFGMGDWQADEQIELNNITIYKWIVPAQVAGTWEWEGLNGQLFQVELAQTFQNVTGKAWMADAPAALLNARLQGDCLELDIHPASSPEPHCFTLHFKDNELQSIFEDT